MRTISTLVLSLTLAYNLTFAQDTLYIYKSGSVVTKRAITDIDSIIFIKPTTPQFTVTDIEGNVYNTVSIGTQVWMVENLKTTKYRDGTNIQNVTGGTAWTNAGDAYCWYNNDEATYKNRYGALYNWYAVNSGKLAPLGWHIPTDAEWTTLINYLGGQNVAGGKLKESGTLHWQDPNTGATNETAFTALPGGFRSGLGFSGGANPAGYFGNVGKHGNWWSSTKTLPQYYLQNVAWRCAMSFGSIDATNTLQDMRDGASVRCIKD